MDNKYDLLLAKYFGGNASTDELEELESYISASPENQHEFDKLTEVYALMGLSKVQVPEIKSAQAKKRFKSYINKQNSEKQTFFLNRFTLSSTLLMRVASVAIIIVVTSLIWKNYLTDNDIIISSNSASQQHILPDNTKLTLAANSTISYQSAKNLNIVELQGQANFNVGHKTKASLRVKAGETWIDDIGTVFEVNAYPESEIINVSVSEGEVHFYTSNDKGLTLYANESGSYNKSTKNFTLLAKKLTESNSMHIEFDAMSLTDAIDVIANAYQVKIELLDKSAEKLPITVNFEGEDIQTVMQVISETLNLKVRKKADVYQLYGVK